jgi:hypothetical protein
MESRGQSNYLSNYLLEKKDPSENACNKIGILGSLEITVINQVPARIFPLVTLFLRVIAKGAIFFRISCRKIRL